MTPAAEKYRLLLDARGLAGRRSGVGKYVSGLVSGIAALQPDDFALRLLCLPEGQNMDSDKRLWEPCLVLAASLDVA